MAITARKKKLKELLKQRSKNMADYSCHFCEKTEEVNCSMYIVELVDGKTVPIQVSVCKECKESYEASFPKR